MKHKYLNLTLRLKRGRTRSDWRYRNRVGQRAESFRKVQIHVYNMYMCIILVHVDAVYVCIIVT